jgi:RimJ/RimL family protein N-acetyltransferase
MISFRRLEEKDLEFLNEVRNYCAEKYLHDSRTFSLNDTLSWFKLTHPNYYVILNEGEKIGYFRLSNHSIVNQNIYIGADLHPNFWSKKLAYPSYQKFIDYLFINYDLNKISLEVLSINVRAYNLYKKLGFVQEGVKRQEIFKQDKFVDSIIMSLLKTEYDANILEN